MLKEFSGEVYEVKFIEYFLCFWREGTENFEYPVKD